MKNKLILIIFAFAIVSPLIFAGEVRNIEYAINISFAPYCVNNVCTNSSINSTDNSTNITTVQNITTCSSVCYGKLTVNGVDQNQLFFEIDTGSDRWKNGSTDFRYGYKSADLGNLSDISGIRQELQNLSMNNIFLQSCNTNLTQCQSDKSSALTNLNNKDSTITELNNQVKQKWYFGIGGILLGILLIKFVYPEIMGRRHPKDPTQAQFASNPSYR